MRAQWTVGKKLALGFGLALVLLLVIGGVSFWSIGLLVETTSWVSHTYEVLDNMESLLSLLKDAETGQRGYLLTGDANFLVPYRNALADLAKQFEKVRRLTRTNDLQQERLKVLEPKLEMRLKQIKETIDLYKKDKEEAKGGVGGSKEAVSAPIRRILVQGKDLMDEIRHRVTELKDEENRLLVQRTSTADASTLLTRLVIVLGSLAAILCLSVIGLVITRGITRPLRTLTDTSQRIASGDLRTEKVSVASTDEIGRLAQAFNGMVQGLRELARQTVGVTGNLATATAEIRASIQEQAAGTRQQAATVQEITTTMEEVSQSGAQIQGKAKQVAAAAEATSAASTAGLDAVQGTTRTMEAIRAQVEQVAENIVSLSEKTQAVGEIIATVNDIAERSNLLALNAAIEAAAAGEQGSRFAVVAGEMKSLADQAKDSTVQVRTILGDIQKGINSSVLLTEEAVKRVSSPASARGT
jgi:methyl-accepting chemotaxis protein